MGREGGNNDDQSDGSAQETLSFAEIVNRKDLRPASAGAGARLLLGGSGETRQLIPLTRNPTVIGRSNNADLVLPDPAVSEYHARILRHAFGYTIEDMGSAAGTFLDDRRINHARLVDGDIIRMGTTQMTFVGDHAADRQAAPATQLMALMPTRGTITGLARQPAVLRVHCSVPGDVQDFETQPTREPPAGAKNQVSGDEAEPSIEDTLRKIVIAVRFIRRNARLVFGLAALGAGVGAATFKLLPPVRAATSMVTLYPAPKVNPIDPQAQQQQGPQSDAMNFFVGAERAFVGRQIVMETLKRMRVPYPSEEEAGRIAKRMRFEGMGNNTYAATLTPKLFDRRDDWHVKFLDAHVKNYLETEVEKKLKVFVAEVDFLRSQTEAAEKHVQEITQEVVKYREAHSEQILAQSALVSSPASLETRRIDLSALISRLTGELEGIRSQIARGSALSQARAQSGQSDREALAALNRKLTELRAQGFANGHPEVERLLNEQKALQKAIDDHLRADVTQFEKRSNTSYDSLQGQADQLQAQLRAAKSELGFIEASRRSLRTVSSESPKVNARLDELLRMKEDAIRQHGLLFDRLKKAEVQLQLERVSASSRYEIIAPSRLDYPPGRKAFLVRLGLGLGIGLLLSALVLGIRALKALFARVARETPAAIAMVMLAGSLLIGCAHEGKYVWVEDLPAEPARAEPIIHPGDTLLVEVQKQPTLSGEFVVRDDGHYAQPMAGSIEVGNKTPRQVATAIAAALREIVVDPVVSVWITKTTPIRVSVVGEVKTPGSYELTRHRNLLSLLALAGWVTDFAHPDRIFVVRVGATERIRFRVQDITTAEPHAARFQLSDADVVVVE